MSRLDSFREKMKGWRFLVFAGSMLLDTFNVNGLTFDQVSIATHFGIDEPTASWSLSAYALTFGSFLLLAGRAGMFTSVTQLTISRLLTDINKVTSLDTSRYTLLV